MNIKSIKQCEYLQKKIFLQECCNFLILKNCTIYELVDQFKSRTGKGPDKFDFFAIHRICQNGVTKSDVSKYINNERIFRYRKQLESIIYYWEYKLNKEGF